MEIEENSPQEQSIALVAEEEHLSREEAALKLLAARAPKLSPEERRAAVDAVGGYFKGRSHIMEQFWEDRRLERELEEERKSRHMRFRADSR